MKPAEALFGPTGAVAVEWPEDSYAHPQVRCRNGLTGKESFLFLDDSSIAYKVEKWIRQGKPGLVQEVFPELDGDEREMLISGMSALDWEDV